MKINFKFSLLFSLFCLIFSSACQKEKLLNDEADVLAFSFDPRSVVVSEAIINKDSKKNLTISIQVKKDTDLSKLKPVFTLSQGATIEPSADKAMDFSQPIKFTVTSEDKKLENIFTVKVFYPLETTLYSFENWKAKGEMKGEEPFEKEGEVENNFWASSNFGYYFVDSEAEKDAYPVRSTTGREKGKAASLVTRKGAEVFGNNIPIITGSLYSGSFDLLAAMTNPMKSTKFGQSINKEPVAVKGYYSYKSGASFTDEKGKVIAGRKDKGIISAVFYEVDKDFTSLDGTNLYDEDHIVSLAKFEFSDTGEDDFYEFNLVLEYAKNAQKPDFENKKYKLALVFSSSSEGGEFLGAVGSELKIDEVEVLIEK